MGSLQDVSTEGYATRAAAGSAKVRLRGPIYGQVDKGGVHRAEQCGRSGAKAVMSEWNDALTQAKRRKNFEDQYSDGERRYEVTEQGVERRISVRRRFSHLMVFTIIRAHPVHRA